MNFLIFEPSISGHHREYIWHMIKYAIGHCIEDEFYFILNEQYKELMPIDFANNERIKIIYIEKGYEQLLYSSNILIRSYKLTKCLRRFIKDCKPDRIILPYLPPFIPLLPFYLRKKNILRGIIFKSPQSNRDIKFSLQEQFLYRIVYNRKCFDRIWLVNNKYSVDLLNKKLKTDVFSVLPDPINIIKTLNGKIIDRYAKNNKIILFHGGGMGKSKGTLELINGLKLLPESKQRNYLVIFGGKMSNSEDRQVLIDFINNHPSYEVIYNDEFISYEDLCSYIYISDYVLIPYKRVEQSSGILGYAALYGVPVIGPKQGLLGKLINDNGLGLTLDDTSSESIAKMILNIRKGKSEIPVKSKQYVSNNRIEKFTSTIFSKD